MIVMGGWRKWCTRIKVSPERQVGCDEGVVFQIDSPDSSPVSSFAPSVADSPTRLLLL